VAAAEDPAPPPAWRVVWEQPLSGPLAGALDVRWASDSSVFLAAGRAGVFEVPIGDSPPPPLPVVQGEKSEEGFFFSSRLGASEGFLVAASPFGGLTWRRLPAPDTLSPELPFSLTVDVDVHGDHLALLGADRDEQGGWTGDDIVWLGRLGTDPVVLAPFFSTLEKRGVEKMAKYWFLELGGLRFLSDGSLLVVPGIEAGAYLFGPDQRLRRTWTTESLRLPDDLTTMEEDQRRPLVKDPRARNAWFNRHRVLDEILPLPDGPALVLRTVERGETRWDLARLRPNGSIAVQPLPLRSLSDQTRLRGDVRGGKVVLLSLEYNGLDPPKAPWRLFVLEPEPSLSAPSAPPSAPPAGTEPGS
jgi:hypothetical protein